jgi:hypothetical protein
MESDVVTTRSTDHGELTGAVQVSAAPVTKHSHLAGIARRPTVL